MTWVWWRITDDPDVKLPDVLMPALPRVGDRVELPGLASAFVREIVWAPWGRGGDPIPSAQVVLSMAPPP